MQSLWAPMFDEGEGGTRPSREQMNFERDCVRRVLRTFGLLNQEKELLAEYERNWGKGWGKPLVTFETFYTFYDSFPIMLAAQSLYRATAKEPLMSLSSWMTGFENLFIWSRYCRLFAQYRAICERRSIADPLPPSLHNLPVGMIFNYDGFAGGLLLHNGEPLTNGLCLRFDGKMPGRLGESPGPIRCWIEPFSDWLAALAKRGWSPKSDPNPLEVETACPLPVKERTIPLLPWTIRALGAGPASVILSWLYHVLHANSDTYPQATAFRTSRRDGTLCVVASQADIGFVLRLTDKQIKEAVAKLRTKGFIQTNREKNCHGVKTSFVLDKSRCLDARLADQETIQSNDNWPTQLEPFRTMDGGPSIASMIELRRAAFGT